MTRHRIAAAVLLAAFWLQMFLALPKLSATSDELVHIPAGYSYWKTRDFRQNPEHPPLVKLLAGLPLLALRPAFEMEAWAEAPQYVFGSRFLYRNDADRLLFWSRIPMTLIATLGALVTFLWASELFGAKAGLLALSLFAFSPNLLAHSMLVTTDVPLATFSTAALYLFWRQRSPVLLGLAAGAAMSSKFSGAILPLIVAALAACRAATAENRKQQFAKELRSLAISGTTALAVVLASYLFAAGPLAYLRGMALVNENHNPNRFYYLFGEFSQTGWWYYFILAFAVKATVPVLILTAFTLARLLVSGFKDKWGEAILLAGIGTYGLAVSLWADAMGVRYILPVFPLLFIWISSIVPYLKNRLAAVPVLLLAAWQAWAALSAFPNYIPYFNEFAGGPAGSMRYLDDSNVDWGQGMKQAAEYVRARNLERVELLSFSPLENPQYYGVPAVRRDADEMGEIILFRRPPQGVYIISSHHLLRIMQDDANWRTYRPLTTIGGSLWVYEF